MATISKALATAIRHHQAGQLQTAERIYRQILRAEPNQPDAIHFLGMLAHQVGKHAIAVEHIRRSIGLKGNVAFFHNNLGNVLTAQGKLGEAAACYRRAVELKPDFAQAHGNLGNVLRNQGKLDEAAACCRQALELEPAFAQAHDNLGIVLRYQGKLDEAAACHRRALELKPDLVGAHSNLGIVLRNQRKLDEAAACHRRALELKPDFAGAHSNLGNVLMDQGKSAEAAACYRRALRLEPDFAQAHNNLAKVLMDQGKLDEAVTCCRRALELKPNYAEALNNLGVVLRDQVKLDEAAACHRRALELKPDFVAAHDSLLVLLLLCPSQSDKTICEENRRWNQMHAEPLAKLVLPHANDRRADRRLRIGYVSPDLRDHCVSFFMSPLLSSHDHAQFEIFCYSDAAQPDEVTARLQGCADVWRNILGLTDEQVASMVRQDQIDILVDLHMHRPRNRLLAFARKPAPVQVCWLSYPGTTGLATMDYRLTDPYLDPPGPKGNCYSEESIRLPDTFWCYDPLTAQPIVSALPALDKGYVTFGNLNAPVKINDPVLKLWAEVAKTVAGSKLMMQGSADAGRRQHILAVLEQEGVAPDRVVLVDKLPRPQYLESYHRIDVGLDTFPYNGHTTSLDSLWMGVPVVTMAGQTIAGRGGLSQLMNLGLSELVAHTPEEFVRIAADLANDLPHLSALRSTLRDRMQNSALMDVPRFTRNIEAAYRDMWRRWCAK